MKTLRKKEKDDKIPMSALPDIVFLLLIFFLITTTIDAEKGIGLRLPPIDPNHEPVPPTQLAKILINSSGQILVNKEIVQLQNLSKIIKNRLQEKPS